MSRELQAVIFDMDGTLVNTAESSPPAYVDALKAICGKTFTHQQVIDAYPGRPPRAILEYLAERPISNEELDFFFERLEHYEFLIERYPEMTDQILTLKTKLDPLGDHKVVGVFTGADMRACELILKVSELYELFDDFVSGDMLEPGRGKPKPDGIELACKHLGVSPSDAAYVGDAPGDMEAARNAGVIAVGAEWGHLWVPGTPCDLLLNSPNQISQLPELVRGLESVRGRHVLGRSISIERRKGK